MNTDKTDRFLQIAKVAAEQAGDYLLENRGKICVDEVDEKGRSDFVTHVDRHSEQLIVRTIQKHFPHHAILAEEGGLHQKAGPYHWVIDPLDGTTNFIQNIPFFCISIAVLKDGHPLVGVVYDPVHQEMFTAIRGKGAFLNDAPITVSKIDQPERAVLGTGFPWRSKRYLPQYLQAFEAIFLRTAGMRRAGSAALDLCYTACGRFAGFWELGLSLWDIAAGSLLVQEAGGVVSDFWGKPNHLNTGYIIAGNKNMHQFLQEVLSYYFKRNEPKMT